MTGTIAGISRNLNFHLSKEAIQFGIAIVCIYQTLLLTHPGIGGIGNRRSS